MVLEARGLSYPDDMGRRFDAYRITGYVFRLHGRHVLAITIIGIDDIRNWAFTANTGSSIENICGKVMALVMTNGQEACIFTGFERFDA